MRNTWDVFFMGYDDDPREIPDIPEIPDDLDLSALFEDIAEAAAEESALAPAEEESVSAPAEPAPAVEECSEGRGVAAVYRHHPGRHRAGIFCLDWINLCRGGSLTLPQSDDYWK